MHAMFVQWLSLPGHVRQPQPLSTISSTVLYVLCASYTVRTCILYAIHSFHCSIFAQLYACSICYICPVSAGNAFIVQSVYGRWYSQHGDHKSSSVHPRFSEGLLFLRFRDGQHLVCQHPEPTSQLSLTCPCSTEQVCMTVLCTSAHVTACALSRLRKHADAAKSNEYHTPLKFCVFKHMHVF